MTRKQFYIYPDYMEGYMSNSYHSTLFFNFLVEEDLLEKLYTSSSDIELLNYFIGNYNEVYTFFFESTFKNDPVLDLSDLEKIKSFVSSHTNRESFDFNLINIILANRYFNLDRNEEGLAAYRELNIDKYEQTAKRFEYLNESFFLNQVRDLANNLSELGMHSEATAQIETMARPSHKILGYICLAENLYEQNFNPLAFDFLDSAYANIKLIKERDLRFREDYRFFQVYTLSKIGGSNSSALVKNILKRIFELNKPRASLFQVAGFADGNDYYQASLGIHRNLTEAMELNCYFNLLYFDVLKKESAEDRMLWSGLDKSIEHRLNYLFNVRGL